MIKANKLILINLCYHCKFYPFIFSIYHEASDIINTVTFIMNQSIENSLLFQCVSLKITYTQIKQYVFSLLVLPTSNSFSSKIFIISKGTKLANPFIKDFICASILDINRHWITKLHFKGDNTYIKHLG